ncbi:MAG: hypothetical protein KIT84_34385 [Labilithrix sp.]|nr:hypothetical protein [Labilithrix sp.]MCW5816136.1 hypothetical protein [Labilithrix sp.]
MLLLGALVGCSERDEAATTAMPRHVPLTVGIVAMAEGDLIAARDAMIGATARPYHGAVRLLTLTASERGSSLTEVSEDGSRRPITSFEGRELRAEATLAAFGRALAERPADRTAVIFWGHGRGWRGFGGRKEGYRLIDGSFEQALRALQRGLGRKIDMLGFDACLMGSWEVAEIAAPYASVLVASPELVPERGWPIDRALESLARAPAKSAADLAERFVTPFADAGRRYVSLSAIDLEAVPEVERAASELARAAVAQDLPLDPAWLEGVLRYRDQGAVDLGELSAAIARSAPSPSLRERASALGDAARRARVARSCRGRHCDALGLSIHGVHALGDGGYADPRARWNRDPAWAGWVAQTRRSVSSLPQTSRSTPPYALVSPQPKDPRSHP